MAPKYTLDAVDKHLKDITELQLLFGGKTIILGGDFRQIPPVVPKAGRSEILNVSKSSPLLTENVKASSGGIGWSNFLIQLRNGELQNDSNVVKVPDDMLSSGDIADEMFGDIVTLEDMSAAVGRSILTPRNFDSLEINNKVLSKLPGQEKIYRSIDKAMNDETEANNDTEYSLEFLNSLTLQEYPPHELHLKKGAVIMLLRNLRVNQGLCNGRRLTVAHMDRYILGCKIVTGANKGEYVLIPRIIFCPPAYDTSPCRFKRRQFPLLKELYAGSTVVFQATLELLAIPGVRRIRISRRTFAWKEMITHGFTAVFNVENTAVM
ncbi:unnamed protein product [Heligmosomoides polygyrus]|uniref:ATP-dependent DNA helicase n=1 Tax=Heligmosomoides polygyrus TaxID=6339 RepID=A0A183GEZ7_HELPZ|nr:unnamed protein product [Heligmosomoides polygyrus]